MKKLVAGLVLLGGLACLVGCSKNETKAEDAPAYAKQMQKGGAGAASSYGAQYGQSAGMNKPQRGQQGGYGGQGGYGSQGGYGGQGR